MYFTFTFSGLAPFSPGSFIVFGFRENPVIGLLSSGPSGKYDCFGLSASPRLFGHVASCKLRPTACLQAFPSDIVEVVVCLHNEYQA